MTLILLHKEYSGRTKDNNGIPYAYRTYYEHYQNYAGKYKVTMSLKHKPGKSIETDWAGATLKLIDRVTGEDIKVYILVGAMHYWNTLFVEVPLSTFNPVKNVNDLLKDGHRQLQETVVKEIGSLSIGVDEIIQKV